LAAGDSSVLVPRALLSPNVECVFAVEVGNFLGGTAKSDELAVATEPAALPSIVVKGALHRTERRASPLVVWVIAASPTCGDDSSRELVYTWTVSPSINTDAVDLTDNRPKVRFPSHVFEVNTTYTFVCEVQVSGSPELVNSARILVDIVSSPIVALISGGSRTTRGDQPLVLDASPSYDPDIDSSNAETALDFAWSCFVDEELCRDVNGVVLELNETSGLQYGANLLQPNTFYTFVVTASSVDGRATEQSVRVAVLAGAPPDVGVTQLSSKADPTRRLAVSGTVVGRYGSFYAMWSQQEGDLDMDDTSNFGAPLWLRNLVIRPHRLTPGVSYVFRLTVSDANGEGYAEVTVVANEPPSGGVVVPNPAEGFAATTAFTLTQSSWTDDPDDYPLSYSFWIRSTKRDTLLGVWSDANEVSSVLPVGTGSNFTVTIWAQ
jgi:hypothetical protein